MSTLADAITAIKSGRLTEGRAILAEILASDGNNVTALLWMTEVAATPEEVRRYLKRVLAIDPNNAPARKGLALLDKVDEQPPLVAASPLSPSPPASADMVGEHRMSRDPRQLQEVMVATPPPVKVSTPKAKWTTRQKMFLAAIVAVIVLIIVAVAWSLVSRPAQEQSDLSVLAATLQPVPIEQKRLPIILVSFSVGMW